MKKIASVLLAGGAIWQPCAASAETVAITNAHVLTMGAAGDIRSATIVIRDNVIAGVGAAISIPPGARIVDAGGRTVTPGFIMAGTTLGIATLPSYGILDDSSTSSTVVSAGYDVSYSVNLNVPEIAEARAEGVTSAIATPDSSRREQPGAMLFGGQPAVIHLAADGRAPILKAKVGVTMAGGGAGASIVGGAKGAQFAVLKEILADVRRYGANPLAFQQNRLQTLGLSASDMDALLPVVRGEKPLWVSVESASDIRHLLDFARLERIRITLLDAPEAWMVAKDIAAAGVPVVIDPEANVSSQYDALGSTYENAARLRAAGVTIAFRAVHARPGDLVRSPRVTVGRLVGNAGLPAKAALSALTIDAARIGGVADRVGSIDTGKLADLVVWEGDPLEATSRTWRVFVNGQEQPAKTRMRLMGERYLAKYRASGLLPPPQADPQR